MKKKMLGFILAFVCLAVLAIIVTEIRNIIVENKNEATPGDAVSESTDIDGYSYSDVEKYISYLASSDDMEKSLARLVDPLSKSAKINVLYIRSVFDIIDAPASLYADILVGMQDSDIVSKVQFDEIYHNLASSDIISGLSRQEIFTFDIYQNTDSNITYISDGRDDYELDTEVDDSYVDHVIDVYIKNDKIFKLNGYGNSDVTLYNVWVSSVDENGCTFLYDGKTKTYHCTKDFSGVSGVASVTVSNDGITDVVIPQDIRQVRIVKVTDDGFVLDDYSIIPYSDDFVAYNVYDDAFCERSMQVLTGYKKLNLVCDGNTAIAAVIDDELVSDKIRVIISNDDYTSYDMKRAEIAGDASYKVSYPDETETAYNSGDSVCINAEDYQSGDIITFTTDEKNGHFQINTLSRSYGIPIYSGKIEIRICDDGVLHIINELPLEEYLYSVVASEMPASSHEEALKSMAICARGYAYSRVEDETFEEYGADLDDSSLCQVYNNVEATEASINAVKDTYGIVPTYNGKVIFPFYFSTSGGMSCTNSEIWGGSDYPYLEANVETINKDKIDLSDEETFRSFIADGLGYDIIDKDMPYYRWEVDYTTEEVSEAINSMLEERVRMSSDNIKIKNDKDQFVSGEISDIGNVIAITVTERTSSGVVATLEIEGTEATIQVTGQTNIRNLITPVNQEIMKNDGTTASGWTSLPSPFYYVDKTDNGFIVRGGGFGHGVGMSQNGANILAGEGHNYKYILRHYYSYIDLTSIYDVEEDEEE